jgi:hypothetical protein
MLTTDGRTAWAVNLKAWERSGVDESAARAAVAFSWATDTFAGVRW